MIERALLIENVDSALVAVDHKGELHWVAGYEEALRFLAEDLPADKLHWYRVSLDGAHVHAAANGTPKYSPQEALIRGLRGPKETECVKNFVENLKKVSA